jgi:hypothetical protein
MTNSHRGEIEAELGGRRYTLCLTLGALADLERAFGAQDLIALAQRFETGRLSARDVLTVIGCGLRGAGHPLSDAEVAALSVPGGLPGYFAIAAGLLAATFGAPMQDGEAGAIPPEPQGA